jgi:hypothetical protein
MHTTHPTVPASRLNALRSNTKTRANRSQSALARTRYLELQPVPAQSVTDVVVSSVIATDMLLVSIDIEYTWCAISAMLTGVLRHSRRVFVILAVLCCRRRSCLLPTCIVWSPDFRIACASSYSHRRSCLFLNRVRDLTAADSCNCAHLFQ